jgi:23S rRNA pseudouridine955/2504/2580 synthase
MPVSYLDINDPEDHGQRIDNFLLRTLKGVPRSHIYRILRSGEVRVNGGRVKASYRLNLNDRVRIPPIARSEALPRTLDNKLADRLVSRILFEDDEYLLLNKPHGVAVHGGSGISTGVVETLRLATDNPRLELVHRLDRGTSGVLALAKTRAALTAAQSAFRERKVKKIYALYVWGVWPRNVHVVQAKLARYTTAWGERRVRIDATGQTARTDFNLVTQSAVAAHLTASLHTGRTHQIRVHAQMQGCPLVGDDKYDVQRNESRVAQPPPRLCLHAAKLVIELPQRQLRAEASLPGDMADYWTNYLGTP